LNELKKLNLFIINNGGSMLESISFCSSDWRNGKFVINFHKSISVFSGLFQVATGVHSLCHCGSLCSCWQLNTVCWRDFGWF